MNYEHQKIQRALKVLMKKKKATYQGVADALGVSSATVKRRLNGDSMTIQQLVEFSGALSVSFYELIELSKAGAREPHLFTEEQEAFLASDSKIMRLFRLILAGESFAAAKVAMNESEAFLRKAARALERAQLARLLPGDRFVPLVQFPVRWREGGKLHQAYDKVLFKNLSARIGRHDGSSGLSRRFELALAPETYQSFCQEVEHVYLKYRGLSEIHLKAPVNRKHLVSGILFIDRFSLWDD